MTKRTKLSDALQSLRAEIAKSIGEKSEAGAGGLSEEFEITIPLVKDEDEEGSGTVEWYVSEDPAEFPEDEIFPLKVKFRSADDTMESIEIEEPDWEASIGDPTTDP